MEATSGIIDRIWGHHLYQGVIGHQIESKKKNNCFCLDIIILEFFVNQVGDLPADCDIVIVVSDIALRTCCVLAFCLSAICCNLVILSVRIL